MKTEAALLVETGKPLVVATIETPMLKLGQVLVEIAFSGACGTQLIEIDGAKGEDKWCPHCLGHEGSGVVVETGYAVTKVKPGDKVVLSWIRGTGIEAGGAVYDWNGRKVNSGGVTTFQRHAVVSENRLTPVPPGMDMDVAILLGCAAPTGMGAVFNVLDVKAGDSVVVFGTGGIGLNAVMAAALAGGNPVIGVDLMDLARPYHGFRDFIATARAARHDVFIVSHKTRLPLLGPEYDMHDAARAFLLDHKLSGDEAVPRQKIFFEETKEQKISRAAELQVDVFIDDLPEILMMPGLPDRCRRILFAPQGSDAETRFEVCRSWNEITALLLGARR